MDQTKNGHLATVLVPEIGQGKYKYPKLTKMLLNIEKFVLSLYTAVFEKFLQHHLLIIILKLVKLSLNDNITIKNYTKLFNIQKYFILAKIPFYSSLIYIYI